MTMKGYLMNIGLEIHIQLNTETKAFCRDRNLFGQEPNTSISEISLGYPGTLPVLNRNHVTSAIKLGHALGCKISEVNYFDRKNYHYPDLPKGYQITQDAVPICIGGSFEYKSEGVLKTIDIHHIHCEEDAGKNIHDLSEKYSYIDYNRGGTPLLEMVTKPDFTSGKEVHDFIAALQSLVRYLEISDANMEEGSLRCDCNVSIRPADSFKLGTRVEVKNVNSKKFAQQSIEYEAKRQYNLIQKGESFIQETRLFNPTEQKTYSMRSKEDVNDYRYFPDPDLQPIVLDQQLIDNIKDSLGVTPKIAEAALIKASLNQEQVSQLVSEKEYYLLFENLNAYTQDAKQCANFIIATIIPYCKNNGLTVNEFPLSKDKIKEIFKLLASKEISHTICNQKLLPHLFENPKSTVQEAVEKLGLKSNDDSSDLSTLVQQVLDKNPGKLKAYQSGKKGLIGFFMGEAMKMSEGKVRPDLLKKLMEEQLNK